MNTAMPDDVRIYPPVPEPEPEPEPGPPVFSDGAHIVGTATVTVTGPDGEVKSEQTISNLITDAGDLYYATRMITGVAPSATADATKVTGMKLGSGATAVAKSGAGAGLVTYIATSNKAFDATFPNIVNLGAGLGVNATYQTTFGPGVGTAASITEAVIVNDSAADLTSSAANTISRITFAATPKAAGDTLTVLWSHKMLGS